VSPERDAWELALVRSAADRRLPLLAICRGIQLLNVALGGTLIQDLDAEYPGALAHDPGQPRAVRSHSVRVARGSRLARALGRVTLEVNSVHHQAVSRPAGIMRVTATAPDGVVEAMEVSDPAWWCVAVQWHPEDLVADASAPERGLFAAFGDAVREHTAARQGARKA